MTVLLSTDPAYVDEINRWRQKVEETLRSETGWLTLTGLYWLNEGTNTVGSAPDCDVLLPDGADRLGTINLHDGRATLAIKADVDVSIDGQPAREAVLRDSDAPEGPSIVKLGSVSFFIIRRSDQYAVRMRDANNPARQAFAGRRWFPVVASFSVKGRFTPHEPARYLDIANTVGQTVKTRIPGRVSFELLGRALVLEAFEGSENELWFVFRDATSGRSTYAAARFMYAQLDADGTVHLDFNKAYHPPCAFTDFATCPLPPRENILPVEITAGERL